MSINQDVKKQPFDRSKAFTIYGSWMENFVKLEKYGVDVPYALFKGIATYALFGDTPDFSTFESEHGFDNELLQDMLEQIFVGIKPNIISSVKGRKANFADEERNEKELFVINFKRDHPEASIRDIELHTGVPKSTVSRILKNHTTPASVHSEDQHSAPEAAYSGADRPDDPDDLPF